MALLFMSTVAHFFIDIYTLNSIHDNQKTQKSPSTLQNTYTITIKNLSHVNQTPNNREEL